MQQGIWIFEMLKHSSFHFSDCSLCVGIIDHAYHTSVK